MNPSAKDPVVALLRGLRQVRNFAPDPVPNDVVNDLLEVARWSGSSKNTQPWHFIVIRKTETLHRLAALRAEIGWIAGAPMAIAIILDGKRAESEFYDEGRVSERILIASGARGFGAGVAWFSTEEQRSAAKAILGIPEERRFRSLVCVGRTRSQVDPKPGTAGRRPLTEIVSSERWAAPTSQEEA